MALRIRRSLAWRNADLLSAPRVVKTTAGIDLVQLGITAPDSIISVIELSCQSKCCGSASVSRRLKPPVRKAAYSSPAALQQAPMVFAVIDKFANI